MQFQLVQKLIDMILRGRFIHFGWCSCNVPVTTALFWQSLTTSYFSDFALSSLKDGSKDILVATDVAGRGIDIKYDRVFFFHVEFLSQILVFR